MEIERLYKLHILLFIKLLVSITQASCMNAMKRLKEISGLYLVKYDCISFSFFNLDRAKFLQECDFKVNFTNVIHRVIVKLGAEVMDRRIQEAVERGGA